MALTHNIILRSINASYNQCMEVQPDTTAVEDFLYFNQSLAEVLTIHHDVEEEFLFPGLQRLSGDSHIMDTNIEEHKVLHASLERFQDYVSSVSAKDYDGATLKRLLNDFGVSVEKHLHAEIPTLLDLYRYDSDTVARLKEGLRQRTTARSDKRKHLPLYVGCADRTFMLDGQVESFPEIPKPVLYLAKFCFEPWHAGAWAFNPSDTFGQPRVKRSVIEK